MNKRSVLMVDDDWKLRNLLRIYLSGEGFETDEASGGQEALQMAGRRAYDLIILDVMMPGMDGWEVCRSIRKTQSVPILMLTALGETREKVQGLGLGADDYLTKPFDPEELIARVHALLRRASLKPAGQKETDTMDFRNLTIDRDGRRVLVGRRSVALTPKEFDLLAVLAKNSGRVFSREQLIEKNWGYDFDGDARVVDIHIKNLREKLKKSGLPYDPIRTVWGVGYQFSAGAEEK